MLISEERRFAIIEYSVVVFPEPVGPVNKIMPWGWLRQSASVEYCQSENPMDSKSGMDMVPKTLITTFSPKSEGSVETRRSADLFWSLALNRPSCGARRSAISREERILMRETKGRCSHLGTSMYSLRTPSIRMRTCKQFSVGSRCTSLACDRMASCRIKLHIFTTGT